MATKKKRTESDAGKGVATPANADEGITFEDAFTALQDAVGRLEAGNLSLDDAMSIFDRGTKLARRCTELLDAAELRVRELELLPEGEGHEVEGGGFSQMDVG